MLLICHCVALQFPKTEWNTLPSVLDSDHYPITITTHIENTEPPPIRVMSKANWNIYMDSQAWNNIPQEIGSNEGSLVDIHRRINTACEEAIPTIVPSRSYPKPFWTPDLTRSRAVREMLYQEYRRRPTLENKIRWKQGRAVHKGNVRRHKEKSWADFTSSLDDNVPISEICKRVRKLRGLPPKSIRVLTDPEHSNITYSTPDQISEILANIFAETSADTKHSAEFLQHKIFTEQNMPNFESLNSAYNQLFSLLDLDSALAKTKDSKPGDDGVNYQVIKSMPNHAKEYLINIYNKFFRDSFFPPSWRKAIIVPVPKLGKNPNSPTS